MGYTDFLERGISMSFDGKFSMNGLYKEISRWAKTNQYTVNESGYNSSKQDDSESLTISLDINKKISDYTKIGMFVTLKGSDMHKVKSNNKTLQEGSLSVSFSVYIKRDYEDVWSRKNYTRFFREFYDRFIGINRMEADENQIKSDVRKLKNAIKDYLGAPVLKK